MLKTAAAFFLAAAFMAGCATAPEVHHNVRCNTAPQWTITDKDGHDASLIFICFGEHSELLYDIRNAPPTPPQPKSLTEAQIKEQKRAWAQAATHQAEEAKP